MDQNLRWIVGRSRTYVGIQVNHDIRKAKCVCRQLCQSLGDSKIAKALGDKTSVIEDSRMYAGS